jgi:hypothetical protein
LALIAKKKRKLEKAASELAQIESQIEEVETAKKKRKQDLLALTASKRTDTEKNESESDEGSDSSSEKKSGGKKVIHDKVCLSFEYFSINFSQIMLNVILHQGPLSKLRNRKIAQHIQSNLVPWIVSKYGPLCRTGCSSQTVRNMLIAIIERDDLAGLGTSIKTLAGRYKMAFDELAKKAWKTSIRAINNHRSAVRDAVMEVMVNPRTATDDCLRAGLHSTRGYVSGTMFIHVLFHIYT